MFTKNSFVHLTADNSSVQVDADSKAATDSQQLSKEPATVSASSTHHVADPASPQSHSQEDTQDSVNVPKQPSLSADSTKPTPAKSRLFEATQSQTPSAVRHHETGALVITKTSYVIPKKQSGPPPPSSHVSASPSSQKATQAPTVLNEPRNLLVPPAPSAPSSRPTQPNTQVRQSIQRSLTGILFKR